MAVVLLAFCSAVLAAVLAYRGVLPELLASRSGGLVIRSLGSGAAPGFSLQDAAGNQVTLESLRGRVLVIGFLDPGVSEARPVVVQQTLWASRRLGTEGGTLFVAMSSAPDTTLRDAGRRWGLAGDPSWRYLTGPGNIVETIRSSYRQAAGVEPVERLELFVVDDTGRLTGYLAGPGQEFGSPRFVDVLERQLRQAAGAG